MNATRVTVLIALALAAAGCGSSRKPANVWNNMNYNVPRDNDADYVPPVTCVDDAPGCQ